MDAKFLLKALSKNLKYDQGVRLSGPRNMCSEFSLSTKSNEKKLMRATDGIFFFLVSGGH